MQNDWQAFGLEAVIQPVRELATFQTDAHGMRSARQHLLRNIVGRRHGTPTPYRIISFINDRDRRLLQRHVEADILFPDYVASSA